MPDPRARLRAESSCRDGPWLACAYSKGLALGPPWAPGPSGVVSGGFGACSQSSSLGACRFVAPCLAQIAVTALPLVRLVQLASGLWGVAAAPLLWRRFTRQVGTPGGQGGGQSSQQRYCADTRPSYTRSRDDRKKASETKREEAHTSTRFSSDRQSSLPGSISTTGHKLHPHGT